MCIETAVSRFEKPGNSVQSSVQSSEISWIALVQVFIGMFLKPKS